MIPASAESDVAEFGISIDGGASDWFSEEVAGFWCTFNGTGFETTVMSESEVSVDGPTSMVSLAGKPSGAAVAESVVPALLPGAEPTPDEVSAGATAERPVQDQPYGERSGVVKDPFGHRWFVGTPLEGYEAGDLTDKMAAEGYTVTTTT